MESTTQKVLIIYTGGTMGMKKDAVTGALEPVPNYLSTQIAELPEMKSPEMPAYTFYEFSPILDSADMSQEEWFAIAKVIEENYYDYDGFVIIHGTDTMAYTACALSFMLENLAKPVVLTGSQIPFSALMSDARNNLVTSVLVAGKIDVPEVCIFFDNKLIRGCRAKKTDLWAMDAFDSPNCPPLGVRGIELNINTDIVRDQPKGRFRVWRKMSTHISVLHLVPGFNDDIVSNVLQPPLEGVIIQSYGAGNAPARKKEFLQSIVEAVKRGVIVVVTSQCMKGTVNLKYYATGQSLLAAGAISGHDMTVECAAIKLSYLMGLGLPKEQIRDLMEKDLRGELSKPKPPHLH